MGSILRKMTAALAAVSMALLSFGPVQAENKNDDKEFAELIHQDFIDSMKSDYLTMHFTVKDYKAMGIKKPKVEFSRSVESIIKEGGKDAKQMLKK